jgi:hypothetical protein
MKRSRLWKKQAQHLPINAWGAPNNKTQAPFQIINKCYWWNWRVADFWLRGQLCGVKSNGGTEETDELG